MIHFLIGAQRLSAKVSAGNIAAIVESRHPAIRESERPPWMDSLRMTEIVSVALSGDEEAAGQAINETAINEAAL